MKFKNYLIVLGNSRAVVVSTFWAIEVISIVVSVPVVVADVVDVVFSVELLTAVDVDVVVSVIFFSSTVVFIPWATVELSTIAVVNTEDAGVDEVLEENH